MQTQKRASPALLTLTVEKPYQNLSCAPQDFSFPVVGIGASAGGLDAYTQLLRHLPLDTGMAFVLIQHLDPNHKSMLTEILGRQTRLPVTEVEDRMTVEPNHIYVIPPKAQMSIQNGILNLVSREAKHGHFMPIDYFLRSLAADKGSQAIAVILSGADADGTQALEAIKAEGGITFAQDPKSAKISTMPTHAAETGLVDFILPPNGSPKNWCGSPAIRRPFSSAARLPKIYSHKVRMSS